MKEIKKIKPLFNSIVTTMHMYTEEDLEGQDVIDGSIVVGNCKEVQKVVAVGSAVRDIEVGDYVMINPERYAVKKHLDGSLKDGVVEDNVVTGYNFRIIDIEGEPHLLLSDRDIDFVVTEFV